MRKELEDQLVQCRRDPSDLGKRALTERSLPLAEQRTHVLRNETSNVERRAHAAVGECRCSSNVVAVGSNVIAPRCCIESIACTCAIYGRIRAANILRRIAHAKRFGIGKGQPRWYVGRSVYRAHSSDQ